VPFLSSGLSLPKKTPVEEQERQKCYTFWIGETHLNIKRPTVQLHVTALLHAVVLKQNTDG
jgi:hypothetical protein